MSILISVLILSLFIQTLRANEFKRQAKRHEERMHEFWKLYREEHTKNFFSRRLPGSKHEYGHDYD